MGSCTDHRGPQPRCFPPPGGKVPPQPLRRGPAAAQLGLPPLRMVDSVLVPASAAACASQNGLPKVQSVGRTGMTLPYACPNPRKSRILGPKGPWHHQRAPKWRLRPQDGPDSQRMMLGPSERNTHRQRKMAERGREGRAHGVMGSG